MAREEKHDIKTSFAIINNFLDSGLFAKMERDFPIVLNEGFRAQNDLSCTDTEYQELLEESDAWTGFHNMVFSQKFWENIVKEYFQSEIKFNLNFKTDARENRAGVPIFQSLRFYTYARLDIGVATKGYGINNGGRGAHIDNKQRLISCLLYFSDQSELQGGEFQMCDSRGQVYETIPVKRNRAIISIQNENAWHKVNPLKSGIRRFVYFSLNSSWNYWGR